MITGHTARRTSAGYTLLEILVICSILGILWAQLMPTLGSLRENARRQSCSNNLKQLGIAFHNYHETYKSLPPNGLLIWTRQSNNGYTWQNSSKGSVLVKLLPFLEQDALYRQLDFKMAGNTPAEQFEFQKNPITGKLYRSEIIPSFLCPSANLDPYLDGTNPMSDPAISCYATSIGAQSMPSRQRWCTDYPGNVFGTGPVQHGEDGRAYRISGIFARGFWAARWGVGGREPAVSTLVSAESPRETRLSKRYRFTFSMASLSSAKLAFVFVCVCVCGRMGHPGVGFVELR